MSEKREVIINCGISHVSASVFTSDGGKLKLKQVALQTLHYDYSNDQIWLDSLIAGLELLCKNEKLKVLIGCLNFNGYTGSELYVFELAKQLIKEGCEVSVCSNLGQPLAGAANKLGIKMYSLQEPPGFKLGDGAWKLKSNEGEVTSQPNTLYKLSDIKFDVIHLNHKPVTEHLSRLYPDFLKTHFIQILSRFYPDFIWIKFG